MNPELFTVKSHQALLAAKQLASNNGNPEITPVHLLFELIAQEDGVVRPVLEKVGATPQVLQAGLAVELGKLPSASGDTGQIGISRDMEKVIADAEKAMKKLGGRLSGPLGTRSRRRSTGGLLPKDLDSYLVYQPATAAMAASSSSTFLRSTVCLHFMAATRIRWKPAS